MSAPGTLDELQIALGVEEPPGPLVAAWRDEYLARGQQSSALVELCVEDLYERQLCYSCGRDADRLVAGEFPWVCARCEAHA